MMRKYFAAFLLLVPVLLTSCWKVDEDWSLCGVDNNVKLTFRIEEGSDEEFARQINNIDVVLFSADRTYIDHKKVDKAQLEEFRGTTFTVDPGRYYVVCWANISANTTMSPLDRNSTLENSYVQIAGTTTGCPLYYAPFRTCGTMPSSRATGSGQEDYSIYAVDVKPMEQTVKELRFARAHRKVNVYIKGFETLHDYDGQLPTVERINISGKYDFLLRADQTPRTLSRQSYPVNTDDGPMNVAEFNTALKQITPDMEINVRYTTDNKLSKTINLDQFIRDNNIQNTDDIDIQVSYDEYGVSVTLPTWTSHVVDPEL